MARRFPLARFRLTTGGLVGIVLAALATSAAADTPSPSPDPVAQAQQAVTQAQTTVINQDTALGSAQANLAAAQQQLAVMSAQLDQLSATVTNDTVVVDRLHAAAAADRRRLSDYLRSAYSRGVDGNLQYILDAGSLSGAMERQATLQSVADATDRLISRINGETADAQNALDEANTARRQLAVVQQRSAAEEAVLAVQESQVQLADDAAHHRLASAASTLAGILVPPPSSAKAHVPGIVFSPVPGVDFTVDTDLTKPSDETAAKINAFFDGTALAGTGDAFIAAEQKYHVSARYFVAHAILESGWGTSAIAQDKHNLFGYGADDANPYVDANTFPSFAACIDFVAEKVAVNYLTPGGAFYHGPTLRGMNVDYASDPHWADKIASIAVTIP